VIVLKIKRWVRSFLKTGYSPGFLIFVVGKYNMLSRSKLKPEKYRNYAIKSGIYKLYRYFTGRERILNKTCKTYY